MNNKKTFVVSVDMTLELHAWKKEDGNYGYILLT